MKILSFSGGFGNQIFEYAFCQYLRKKYPNEKIYGYYNSKKLSEHYGLEIDRWFDIKLPPQKWYSTSIVFLFFILKKIVGEHRWIDTSSRLCNNEKAKVFVAYKYTKYYVPKGEWIKWKIIKSDLSKNNISILDYITTNNTWFIHVRRGDYFSARYKELYEGCCPLTYYNSAIQDVINKEDNPKFICFSDDIAWAKDNLPPVISYFVDWNTGNNSPLDMYLMSQCNGAIIANSTFSYWGAVLGNKKKRVYYPSKWINSKRGMPDIFMDGWISM